MKRSDRWFEPGDAQRCRTFVDKHAVGEGEGGVDGEQGAIVSQEIATEMLKPVGDDGVVSLAVKTGGQTIRVRKVVPKEGAK